ncbi:MAG TPA: sigma-70 family RNA polymerase sigma factor [Caulobacteraceae bacterium]
MGLDHEQAREGRQSDAALLSRIRGRDPEAFEELYHSYRGRLERFLFRLLHRPQVVEELIDDTLMVVWQRADSFNGESKLSTWIFAIAYRKAMKALRRQDDPVEDARSAERVSLDPSPEEDTARRYAQKLLMKAVAELSPEHRAVVEFTYFHEMGYREIAEIVGCPVDTVKTRMFHARRHLKHRLAGHIAHWL